MVWQGIPITPCDGVRRRFVRPEGDTDGVAHDANQALSVQSLKQLRASVASGHKKKRALIRADAHIAIVAIIIEQVARRAVEYEAQFRQRVEAHATHLAGAQQAELGFRQADLFGAVACVALELR